MRAYLIRRLLLIIPTLWILTTLVFLSVRFIPGDTVDAMVGELDAQGVEVDRAAIERMLGLGRACLGAVWTLDRSAANPPLDYR